MPPCSRVVDGSAWVKASKRVGRRAGSIPTPVSVTSTRRTTSSAVSDSTRARIETSPAGVNFTALDPRLARTCPSRPGSPRSTAGTSGWQPTSSSIPFSWAGPLRTSALWSNTARTSKSTSSSSSFPASIFERSRMSLMMPSRVSPAPCRPTASRRWWASRSVRSSRSLRPMTPFMGVRISWLIVARNSDLRREASMASSRAAASWTALASRWATWLSCADTCSISVCEFSSGGTSSASTWITQVVSPSSSTGRETMLCVASSPGGGRVPDRAGRPALPRQAGSAPGVPAGTSNASTSRTSPSSARRKVPRASQPVNAGRPTAASWIASSRSLVWLAAVAMVCRRCSRRVASDGELVGRDPLGDVLGGAAHPHRVAGGVPLDPAEPAHPAHRAAAGDHPAVPGELVLAGEDRGHRGLDHRPVLGVDEAEEARGRSPRTRRA